MNFDHFRFTARAVLLEWVRQPTRPWRPMSKPLRADPRDVRAARSVAWIHAAEKRWTAAVEWFGKALELEPEHADTWFNLGYAREHAGDRRRPWRRSGRAAELNPKHDRAWYGMGMIHAHMGDHAAAAEALDHAAELQPMNGAAWYALGMARHHNNEPDQVSRSSATWPMHEPQTAKRLIQDAERADLAHLVAHIQAR
jgi:tetratricopeptide (TPR) repeat protein